MADSIFREGSVKEAAFHKEEARDDLLRKRTPFSMLRTKEFEAYLSEMSSQGLVVSKRQKPELKIEFVRGEPQKNSYRLLLGTSELEEPLLNTIQEAGWELLQSVMGQTQKRREVFHIFIQSDEISTDTIFQEVNRKRSTEMNPVRDSVFRLLLQSGAFGLMFFIFYLLDKADIKAGLSVGYVAFAFALMFSYSVDQYYFYKAESNFIQTYQNSNLFLENENYDWQKLKKYEDWKIILTLVGGILVMAVVFIIAAKLQISA